GGFGREEEDEWTPDPQPPAEFVVLAGPGFAPLVAAKAGLLQLGFVEQMLVGEVLEVATLLPADPAQPLGHGIRQLSAVVVAGVIDHAAVQVDPQRFAFPLEFAEG